MMSTEGVGTDEPGDRWLLVLLDGLLLAACAVSIAAYLWIAVHRLGYRFDLEWMEGACVDHVARILSGKSLYAAPSLTFVPFVYPPLYYYVSAALARIIGVGFLPLRLVSFASSLILFALTYRLVSLETGSRRAGWLAAGLFAATYRLGGAWLDIARNDSLFLALMMLAVFVVRTRASARAWGVAGVALALAALTKQTAAIVAVPLAVYGLAIDRRRAFFFIGAFVAVLGGTTLWLNRMSGGWYLQYVWYMPQRIQALQDIPPGIWQQRIFGPLPVAFGMTVAFLIAAARRRDQAALFYGLLLPGLIGAAWVSGRHSGAYDNVFIPAHLALAIGTALAFADVARIADNQRGPAFAYGAALGLVQLLLLVYPVSEQMPTAHDAQLAGRLERLIASTPGEVFMPHHGFLADRAGKTMAAHTWAMVDLLRAGDVATVARVTTDVHEAFAQQRFRTIVLDKIEPWFETDLDRYYTRSAAVLDGEPLWTRTGYKTTPRWIYIPK